MLFINGLSRALQVPLLFRQGIANPSIQEHSHVVASGNSINLKSPLTAEFATLVESTLEHYKVPGLAVAVLQDKQTFVEVWCDLF